MRRKKKDRKKERASKKEKEEREDDKERRKTKKRLKMTGQVVHPGTLQSRQGALVSGATATRHGKLLGFDP